ncbi:hypothetical protein CTI12_AA582390 [Artemisia annua]|uniref:Uncharacterized protein n=1 Tax=Artemisia annua TaxID=35608 RepID=A0A2U1KNH6_ARTAN|nr:hypothetical protein CTI12_AA582390 [Artemisia annua]
MTGKRPRDCMLDSECSDVSLNYDYECSDVSLNYDTECSDVSLNYDYECSDLSLNYDTVCSGGSSPKVEAFVKSTDSDESSSSSSSSSEVSRGPHGCEMESGKIDGTSEEIVPRQGMGENKLLLLKFRFHVGGKFMELPFRYEGGKVEVRESYEFFASWVDFGTNCGFFLMVGSSYVCSVKEYYPWISKIKKCTTTVFELNGNCKP